jgi:ferredoxin-thioredoxin reductase catalytic subunit
LARADLKLKKEIRDQIDKFIMLCSEKGLVTNPRFSYMDWVEEIQKKNCCPCANERLECPCNESEIEIRTNGKCKCEYFMTYDYLQKFLDRMIALRIPKKVDETINTDSEKNT